MERPALRTARGKRLWNADDDRRRVDRGQGRHEEGHGIHGACRRVSSQPPERRDGEENDQRARQDHDRAPADTIGQPAAEQRKGDRREAKGDRHGRRYPAPSARGSISHRPACWCRSSSTPWTRRSRGRSGAAGCRVAEQTEEDGAGRGTPGALAFVQRGFGQMVRMTRPTGTTRMPSANITRQPHSRHGLLSDESVKARRPARRRASPSLAGDLPARKEARRAGAASRR